MADTFRVIVTGSRTWRDYAFLCEELDGVLREHPHLVVVHGACGEGADAMAHAWVRRQLRRGASVRNEGHPADWNGPCREECDHGPRPRRRDGSTSCPAAGPYRNEKMVRLGASACLAFIAACTDLKCGRREPHGTHGASGLAELAAAAGIDTRRYQPWLAPLRPDRDAMETAP